MHISITVPLNVPFGQMAVVYCAYLVRQVTLCGKKCRFVNSIIFKCCSC